MPCYIKSNFVQNVFIKSKRGNFLSHYLKGRSVAHVAICVKSKFNQSYKDIDDNRFQEVLDYIEFLKKILAD